MQARKSNLLLAASIGVRTESADAAAQELLGPLPSPRPPVAMVNVGLLIINTKNSDQGWFVPAEYKVE